MSPIKMPWHRPIKNGDNGNVQNATAFFRVRNSMGIISNVSFPLKRDSQTGMITWLGFFSAKSSPYVKNAIQLKHEVKMKSELKVGDRVIINDNSLPHANDIGTIVSFPTENIVWVSFGSPGQEHGYAQKYLEKVEHAGNTMIGQSIKKDDNKYDPTMLTIEMIELVSKVRMFGAKKYARGNFKITGFKYTRSLAAALRHIFAYLGGEDNDPESGLSHLGHAICSIEHCIYDNKHHPENDDRKD